MAPRAQSRKVGTKENFFGFLTEKKVTYHRDVAGERKKLRAGEVADRRHRLALKKLAADERAAEAKIATANRKIEAAEKQIATGEKKFDKGGMAEAQFAAMKARMEREIEAQERHKAATAARVKGNPKWGFGIYQGVGFGTRQVAHFGSKAAAETYARSHGLKDYAIRRAFPKTENPKRGKKGKRGKRNPAADAQALSGKFHGRKATTERRIVETLHVPKNLMEIGPLVRLVVDTPTGLVAVLNFNTSDPKKIVLLSTSPRDPKTGKLVGKQLYLRGGDQEINLAGLKMDSPLWIRDKMELGRLHEFKRGDPALIVDGQPVNGSITYRTRKGMDDFKLIDYWHRAGEETSKKAGPAARPLVLYDYRNKKLEIAGGQYVVDSPGIIN